MKKKHIYILIYILILTMGMFVGCEEKNKMKEDVEKNISIFEEAFYEGVKSVTIVGTDKCIDDKELINEIKNEILSVGKSKSNKEIFDYYGTTILVFSYDDGSSKKISMTSELILDLGETYSLDKDICSLIRKKFVDK